MKNFLIYATSFLLMFVVMYGIGFLAPISVFGFGYGYGYDCGGGYGYGYSCSDSEDEGSGDSEKPTDSSDAKVLKDKDEISGTVKQKYNHYKKKYKNASAKQYYRQIKTLKKGNEQDFAKYLQMHNLYKQYKHLSTSEAEEILSPIEFMKYKEYRKYRGYKRYKQLRKQLGK